MLGIKQVSIAGASTVCPDLLSSALGKNLLWASVLLLKIKGFLGRLLGQPSLCFAYPFLEGCCLASSVIVAGSIARARENERHSFSGFSIRATDRDVVLHKASSKELAEAENASNRVKQRARPLMGTSFQQED
jgi:hypothetical protein